MARLGVTYHDVANAAHQLLMQDKQPTIELIRRHLGTGSSTTIANHLRQWRTDQAASLSLPQQENVPQEMIGMLKGLWERLSVQAGQKASEIEAKTQQEMAELKQELEKYKNNNRRWQQLFHQWQQERERLLMDKQQKEEVIETQQQEIAVLKAQLEAQAFQANEKKLHIEDLHRINQQAQANLEHYRESTREQRLLEQAQFEQQKQEMQQEIKAHKNQLMAVKDRIYATELDYKALQQNHQLLQSSYHVLKEDHKKQDRQLIELRDTKQEQQQISKHWERQCHQNKQMFDVVTQQFVELQNENKILLKQFMDSQMAFKEQLNQMKLFSQEKWSRDKV